MADRKGVTLNQLRAFVRAYDAGGFRAAAGDAGATALAHQVTRLGEALGVKLVTARAGPGAPLWTTAALEVLPAARQALAAVDSIELIGADYAVATKPVVRIACYPSHTRLFVVSSAGVLTEQYRVRFHGTSDGQRASRGLDLFRALFDGLADIAICPDPPPVGIEAEFSSRFLYDWQLVAVPPRGRTVLGPLSVSDLAENDFVCSPAGHRSRGMLDEAAAAVGITLRPIAASDSMEALLSFSNRGLAWCVAAEDSLPMRRRIPAVPVLDATGRTMGGTYRAWYRTDAAEKLDALVTEFERRTAGFRQSSAPPARPA